MRIPSPTAPAVLIAAVLSGALATAVVSVPAATAATPRMDRLERAIVRGIDRRRAHAGLRAMRPSASLARAADHHSREMLAGDYFAHSSRNGGSFATRIRRYTHASTVGETLAWTTRCGRRAARRVVSMWMHSPPHRAILMSTRLHRVGIARRTGRLGSRRACVVTGDFAR
jgi:uncharacterized protein YkwD